MLINNILIGKERIIYDIFKGLTINIKLTNKVNAIRIGNKLYKKL